MQQDKRDFEQGEWLFKTPTDDDVYFFRESMIIKLNGKRRVVSTSLINGGSRTDIRYLFNNSCGKRSEIVKKEHCGMRGKNLVEHYSILAEELGLPVACTVGMGTAALIENAATATRSYHGVTVMAIATAGVDVNGGRAGDPASYDEFTKSQLLPPSGTINIFLFINAKLNDGTLTRALITATEAKSAALQELMAVSNYSEGMATGSGTDSFIAVSDETSNISLFNAGKHVLLGEMIGQSVKEAVTKALAKQSGMTPQRQASIEWQCKRYGITKEAIKHYYEHCFSVCDSDKTCFNNLDKIVRDNLLLASVAAIVHLCDQNRWGMITDESLLKTSGTILNSLRHSEQLEEMNLARNRVHDSEEEKPVYKKIISDIILTLAEILNKRMIATQQ